MFLFVVVSVVLGLYGLCARDSFCSLLRAVSGQLLLLLLLLLLPPLYVLAPAAIATAAAATAAIADTAAFPFFHLLRPRLLPSLLASSPVCFVSARGVAGRIAFSSGGDRGFPCEGRAGPRPAHRGLDSSRRRHLPVWHETGGGCCPGTDGPRRPHAPYATRIPFPAAKMPVHQFPVVHTSNSSRSR